MYQLAEAVGQTFSDSSIDLPTWLNSYTKTPLAYGYWTSTPYAAISDNAWFVSIHGYTADDRVHSESNGIRPVITLSLNYIAK